MKPVYISLLFVLLSASGGQAQELFIDGGKSVTTYKFTDVLNNDLNDLQSSNHSYVDVGYRGKLFTEAINFVGGFGVHTYGATGNDAFNNLLIWETTYASINLGIDAEMFTVGDFSFHLRATAGPEIMLQGTQTLNNQVFNILNEQDFETPFVFIRGGASLEYNVAENMALFFQYRFGLGSQINKSDTGAELKYVANDFGIGLIFKLSKKDSEEEKDKNGSADQTK